MFFHFSALVDLSTSQRFLQSATYRKIVSLLKSRRNVHVKNNSTRQNIIRPLVLANHITGYERLHGLCMKATARYERIIYGLPFLLIEVIRSFLVIHDLQPLLIGVIPTFFSSFFICFYVFVFIQIAGFHSQLCISFRTVSDPYCSQYTSVIF